jgi:hypothetical protein
MNFKNILLSLGILLTFSVRATCIEVIKQQFADVLVCCEKQGLIPTDHHLNAHIQLLAARKKINQLETLHSFLTTYKVGLNNKKVQNITSFKYLLLKKLKIPLSFLEFTSGLVTAASFGGLAGALTATLMTANYRKMLPTADYCIKTEKILSVILNSFLLGIGSFIGNLATTELINSYKDQERKISYLDKTIEIINNLLTQIEVSKALYYS